jgi:hypothetical protein
MIKIDEKDFKFSTDQIAATPGVTKALALTEILPALLRHLSGDWGDLDAEDKAANDQSLIDGSRLLSAYHSAKGIKFWIITEADRSVTTVLLPSEY